MQVENVPLVSDPWLPVYVGVITATATLLGVIAGGFITYFVKKAELAHQRDEENRKLKISRIETVHLGISNLITNSMELFAAFAEEKIKPLHGDNKERFMTDAFLKISRDFTQLTSLSRLYIPSLRAAFDGLEKTYDKFAACAIDFLYNEGTHDQFNSGHTQLVVACNELMTKIEGDLIKKLIPSK